MVEIKKLINGKLVSVPLKDAAKENKSLNDQQRLNRYKGERADADNGKKLGI